MRKLLTALIAALLLAPSLVPTQLAAAQPISWEECARVTVTQNMEVLRALGELEVARGTVATGTASAFYPSANIRAISFPPAVQINLSQPLFNFAMQPVLRQRRDAIAAAETNLILAMETAVHAAATQFVTIQFLEQRVANARRYVGALSDQAAKMPELLEAGRASKGDELRQNVRLTLAQNQVRAAELEWKTARLSLVEITGAEVNRRWLEAPLGSLPTSRDFPKRSAKEWTEIGLRDRPDLRLLRALREVGINDISIALAPGLPSLDALANSRLRAKLPSEITRLDDNFDRENNSALSSFARFGTAARWRMLSGGAIRGAVIGARTQVTTREILIAKTERDLPSQIAVLLDAVAKSEKALAEVRLATKLRRDAFEQATEGFQAGIISLVEVLRLEEDLLLQADLENRADQILQVAALDLMRACGQVVRLLAPQQTK